MRWGAPQAPPIPSARALLVHAKDDYARAFLRTCRLRIQPERSTSSDALDEGRNSTDWSL